MTLKHNVKFQNFLIAFLVAALLFFSGLFLGFQITSFKINKISSEQNSLSINLEALELRYELLEKNICNDQVLNEVARELDEMGKRLSDIERYGKDKNVEKLEEEYFLLEIRHYLLLKRTEEVCGKDFYLVLYFYSVDCKECNEQGYILGYIQNKVGYDKMKIYSFDFNSKSPAVKTLVEIHKIKNLPAIVINDESYEGFKNLEALQNIVGNV